MIGRLRGQLVEKKPPHLLLDVNGVGYEISAPLSTFYQLPDVNQEVTLLTHLVVREDGHFLFGFYKENERQLFRSLIRVNGVGPKLALTILSGMETEHFVRCVREEDTARLVTIPGIGKKTAERLIIETRDHLSQWNLLDENTTLDLLPESEQDAMSALIALGYKAVEAKKAISAVAVPNASREDLIRLALKQMSK